MKLIPKDDPGKLTTTKILSEHLYVFSFWHFLCQASLLRAFHASQVLSALPLIPVSTSTTTAIDLGRPRLRFGALMASCSLGKDLAALQVRNIKLVLLSYAVS